MSLTTRTVERFDGINLSASAEEVGATAAVALSNVDVDIPGQIRTRPGLAYVTAGDTATFSNTPIRLVENVSSTAAASFQAAASATKLATYKSGGVHTGVVTATTRGVVDLMPGPTSLGLWVLDETGLRNWDEVGHSFSAVVTNSPKGGYLARMPLSGRIVIAGANTSGPGPDRVNFSDADTAGPFTSTNWVDISPGDEVITGAVTLGTDVIVFKQTRAYVFYGESVDADGGVVFNYRVVELGDRIAAFTNTFSTPGRFSADQNAVYFVASRGVYAFNGSSPTLISGALNAFFRDESSVFGTGWGRDSTAFTCATADRVYVSALDKNWTFVLDKATGQWTAYNFVASAMAPSTSVRSAYLMNTESNARLALLSPASTADYGVAIDWSYQSGRYPLADPGQVAVVPETSLLGSGTVTLRLDSDLYSNLNASTTLGTAPAVAEGWPGPVDQEGTWLQYTLSGSGSASVAQLKHFVSSVKPTGVR